LAPGKPNVGVIDSMRMLLSVGPWMSPIERKPKPYSFAPTAPSCRWTPSTVSRRLPRASK
jgi:hypothetical protein